MTGRERLKIIIINMNHCDVVGHKLGVLFSSRNVKLRVSDDLLDLEDDVVLLLSVGVGVPLTTQHLHVVPRHLRDLGTGATVLSVSAPCSTHIGTAAVGHNISLLRLAEIRAVGGSDEDGGAGGSGQQGDPAVVSYWPNTSQATQPGVAMAGVLEGRNTSNSFIKYVPLRIDHLMYWNKAAFLLSWWFLSGGGSYSNIKVAH